MRLISERGSAASAAAHCASHARYKRSTHQSDTPRDMVAQQSVDNAYHQIQEEMSHFVGDRLADQHVEKHAPPVPLQLGDYLKQYSRQWRLNRLTLVPSKLFQPSGHF